MGALTRGGYRYYLAKHFAHRSVAISFDPEAMTFICQPEGSEDTLQVPIQGIMKEELMGDLVALSLADLSIGPSFLFGGLAAA